MEVTLNGYYTLILATLVLLLGRFLVKKIKFLEDFNIPEPVAGGLVAAAIVYALNLIWGHTFSFNQALNIQYRCLSSSPTPHPSYDQTSLENRMPLLSYLTMYLYLVYRP